ncbi:hypothetical protein J4Q44_G00376320 [Coregonus suidteri]|uniref:Uncharacterized protein n=1 Tax=Coregonus suidteri TaxID=861788 RepID=A0AAN8QJK9_9TELE
MANNKGSSLSNARGREIYVGREFRDSISLLDVLYANEFEEEDIDSAVAKKTEADFYRGAPPQWLNFYWDERATSVDKTTPFIKRDGYSELIKNIQKRRKRDLTSTIKLLHQPGSGGTTLAKQVLWDMRKKLRCAVLTGPTSDITAIAKQVIHLFTAGSQRNQTTVLLMLEDERIQQNLQDAIMKEIAERNITTHVPVVIILNCVQHEKMGFDVDLNKHVLEMQESYKNTYKKHLRSRYLRPLIFLAKVNGVVRQHRVFACVDGKEIEVCAYQQSKVWMSGDVCFYLGFTIRGPVAYGIHYPSHSDRIKEEEPRKKLEVPDIKSMKDGAVRS